MTGQVLAHYSFLVQNPDNTGENSFHISDDIVAEFGDTVHARRELMRRINRTTSEGKPEKTKNPRTVLRTHDGHFTLQVDFDDSDESGRISPILCFGPLPRTRAQEWLDDFTESWKWFASAQGRVTTPSALEAIREAGARLLPSKRRLFQGRKDVHRPDSSPVNLAVLPKETRGMQLPAHPSRRRVIVLLTRSDLVLLRRNSDGLDLLNNPRVQVLELQTASNAARHEPILARMDARGLLYEGCVVVQNPTSPDEYFEVNEAIERAARAKLLDTVTLCQTLGATSVVIEEVTRYSREGQVRWSVSGSGQAVAATAQEMRQVESFVNEVSLSHRFDGGRPDPAELDRLLGEPDHNRDDHLTALIQMARGTNRLREQVLEISTRTETNRMRTWIAEIRVPVARVQAGLDSVVKEEASFGFRFRVRFDAELAPPTSAG